LIKVRNQTFSPLSGQIEIFLPNPLSGDDCGGSAVHIVDLCIVLTQELLYPHLLVVFWHFTENLWAVLNILIALSAKYYINSHIIQIEMVIIFDCRSP